MQLWVRAAEDRRGALDAYVRLCHHGGDGPFGALMKSVGLVPPFEEGSLESVVKQARRELARG
jgi:hypothetical protein